MTTNQPLWKSGNVAVWPARAAGQHQIYTVSDGAQGSEKVYTNVFSKVSGTEMTPEEIGRLYMGEEIEFSLQGKESEYAGIVMKKAIKESRNESENGKVFTNRTLELGIVLPLRRRDTQELFGYKIGGVAYFKHAGSKEAPIVLNATDALILSQGKSIEKAGHTVTVSEVTNTERGKNARLLVVPHEAIAGKVDSDMPDLELAESDNQGARV